VSRALLVPHQNVFDGAGFFSAVEFVVKGQNCAAGITKNMLDAVADQAVDQSKSTRCTPDGYFSF
jgi:hypothetical protein